jgi:hypothetical protein
MRTKLKYMLDIWKDGGFVVQLTLSTGDVIYGRLKETDTDEVIIEPDLDGRPGPLTVVQLHHVVAATYVDDNDDETDYEQEDDAIAEAGVSGPPPGYVG